MAKGNADAVSDPKERALLGYARKLTREPEAMQRADVEALRAVGWEDPAILSAAQVVSYFNWVNRMADGLGVELEPGFEGEG